MNIEDHILALVTKKLSNGASEEELRELDALLQQHPDIYEKVNLMTEWWHSDTGKSIEANSYFRFQKILEKIKETARLANQINFVFEVLILEKKIDDWAAAKAAR